MERRGEAVFKTYRQTDRQTDKYADYQEIDKRTDRLKDRWTGRLKTDPEKSTD